MAVAGSMKRDYQKITAISGVQVRSENDRKTANDEHGSLVLSVVFGTGTGTEAEINSA